MAEWEDYFIDDSNVLKNKFNITNASELKEKEIEISVSKLAQLYFMGITGNFDEKHLCQIHKFIFDDIYYFAGNYREVNVYKLTGFLDYKSIKNDLPLLMNKMNNMEIDQSRKFEIAKYIADYYYELIYIHPFREGNGRTIREFIRQLVLAKFPQYELDLKKINSENFMTGVIEHRQYPLLLAYEINNALIEKDNDKTKKF